MNGQIVYTLSPDQEVSGLIRRFLLAYENRHFRIKAVEQIVWRIR